MPVPWICSEDCICLKKKKKTLSLAPDTQYSHLINISQLMNDYPLIIACAPYSLYQSTSSGERKGCHQEPGILISALTGLQWSLSHPAF